MNNTTLALKIDERINKLASADYDNIEGWQKVEAFNKSQIEWVRRQLRGANMFRDGDEQSRRRIDDLQRLLKTIEFDITKKDLYYEGTNELPTEYLEYKRIDAFAKDECCTTPRPMTVYLAEEDNRSQLLRDVHKKPSLDWAETFSTLISNKARIYTNDEFEITEAHLTYYRFPRNVEFLGVIDPITLVASPADVTCEFKDDIVELLIDEAVAILAGDIESGNQHNRGSESAERSN